ncbi:hemicentin-1 isoform X3 [Pangasianodon hypophthalmus]|uniref:hemicentin-1 isoform X3 n=1 Tax=Pangasianodon hypophthalmus TaxID=310915 RepID=UPI00230789DE|nr:hemicentin-1 isoform X3 [Pangasianodon hypophthalmus]
MEFWVKFLAVALALFQTRAQLNPEHEISGSSLAFVFDVTGSMYDDLQQVMDGASRILHRMLSRTDTPIRNFVLVPFHDPDIGPVSITSDPKQFQHDLQELFVQGGGDCPEMSVGAIHSALEVSLPGSFIYVFTDARAKDYRRKQEVLQLVQLRQSQVVFVLTGDCGDRSQPGYRVYEEIAATSSGQIFHLDKQQVNEVLKWVEETVRAMKVHLLSSDHELGQGTQWELPFDPSLKEVTVSLSGPTPRIELRDPLGRIVGERQGLRELLNIPNSVLVVNLKNPRPGLWTLKVVSSGRHTLRVTGVSNLDFRAGFSTSAVTEFSRTRERPIKGAPVHALLKCSGLNPPGVLSSVVLVSKRGEDLLSVSLPVPVDGGVSGVWSVPEMQTPSEGFFIKVRGKDGGGFDFHRLSSVLYTNIIPVIPVVEMPSVLRGMLMQSVLIECSVQSDLPFTLTFRKDGEMLGHQNSYQSSAKVSWEILHVSVRDEGMYECMAQSTAGVGRAHTHFTVTAPPMIDHSVSEVTAAVGEPVTLPCVLMDGAPPTDIIWTHNGQKVQSGERISIRSDGSLHMKRATAEDAGKYLCTAVNVAGSANVTVTLQIHTPPVISAAAAHYEAAEGVSVSLPCETTGIPKPSITWTKGDEPVSSPPQSDGSLLIFSSTAADSGRYICTASSSAGETRREITLTVHSKPRILGAHEHTEVINMMVEEGAEVILPCEVEGSPAPTVSWSRNGQLLPPITAWVTVLPSGSLKIRNVQLNDSNIYTCTAENPAGVNTLTYSLQVQVPLRIVGQQEEEVSAVEGHMASLLCDVQTHPAPEIIWTRDGQLLQLGSGVRLLSGGKMLQISRVQQRDAGQYVCTATSSAGQDQKSIMLNVYAPPTLLPLPHSVSEVMTPQIGSSVTLSCEARGVPEPEVTWYRNGQKLNSGRTLQLASQKLTINSMQVSDGGVYTCKVSNPAGQLERKFMLTAHVTAPLVIEGPVHESVTHTLGSHITLVCDASGVPAPNMRWLKDSLAFGSGSVLSLGPLELSHSGVYTCIAHNSKGETHKNYTLTIQVPPTILNSGPSDVSALVGAELTLKCHAEGTPTPQLAWMRNGVKLDNTEHVHVSANGSTLTLLSVKEEDAGTYTCLAISPAGQESKIYTLFVLVPPSILKHSDVPLDVQAVHDGVVSLECHAVGIPPPQITWLKDGNPLQLTPRTHLHSTHTLLRISPVQLSDSGLYTCVARSKAGFAEQKFHLQVEAPAMVEHTEPMEHIVIVRGSVVTLVCEAHGVPPPTLTWMKDSEPLSLHQNMMLHDGGETRFQLLDVQLEDAGLYSCTAKNQAGTSTKTFNLTVLEPPKISSSLRREELMVVVDGVLELECVADGVPPPTVSWMKDGRPLEDSRVVLHRDGQILTISNIQVEDAGVYTCLVSNLAGEDGRSLWVRVQLPPTLLGSSDIRTVSVPLKGHMTLECRTDGELPPEIEWYRDNIKLQLSGRIQSIAGGQYLEIGDVRKEDGGLYSCVVSNMAGSSSLHFNVQILLPPVIREGSPLVTAHVNQKVLLPCEVEGDSAPSVLWRKDGVPVLFDNRFVLLPDGSVRIESTQLTDAGRYYCSVSNEAGSDQRSMELRVYVGPSISPGPLNVTVTMGQRAVLGCESLGVPVPQVSWKRNGQALNTHSGAYRLMPSGSLLIISPSLEDEGYFECTVTNEVGEEQRVIEVMLQVPPSIEDDVTSVTAIKMESVVLPCHVTGRPTPSISWSRGGTALGTRRGSYRTLPTGMLEILAVNPTHAGRYTCSAQNTAGVARKHIILSVHEAPEIRNMVKEVNVLLNQEVVLICDVHGFPKPSVTWLKEGVPIAKGQRLVVLSDGSLRLSQVTLDDAGTYSCLAQNAAGTTEGKTQLILQVPPVISVPHDEYTLSVGESVSVPCSAIGQPEPELQWHKLGGAVRGRANLLTFTNGTLHIKNAQLKHAGVYTCTALNSAGRASRDITLILHVPPMILVGQSEVSVIQGFQSLLPCSAQGVPEPKIHWEKNGDIIQNLRGKFTVLRSGELIIERTQPSDAGVFTCVAMNAAGSAHHKVQLSVNTRPEFKESPSDMTLRVGQNLTLTCHAHSTPPPVITWTVNSRPYTGFSVDEAGRTFLMIGNVTVRDSGSYVCTAENSVGSIRALAFVRVTEPPVLRGDGHVSQFVSRGAVVVLDCPVRGTPAPVLRWFKDGHLLKVTEHLHRLPNGSLVLYSAMSRDSGEYQCVAENEVGVIKRTISLKVQVAGGYSHWEQWGPCSVTCGHGLQQRTRFCNNPSPTNGGAACEGPDIESKQCQASLCSGDSLRRARASVIGMVNDQEFGVSFLEVNISENSKHRSSTLEAHMENVPPSVGPLLKVLVSALTPIYWTAVYESAGTKNGFSISRGNFRQESQLEFHTGEILKMTHVVRGVDAEGVLLVDVVINGFIPAVFLSPVLHQHDFDETYVQVGSGQIYSWSTQNSLQQDVDSVLTLRCNHSLVFDGSVKRFAPLLQQIRLSDISSSYNMLNFRLDFHITAMLSLPDGDGEKCPEGFLLDKASYCADEDECVSDSPCSHSCINIMGSFRCSCPSGFNLNTESNSCQDIDECVDGSHMCLYNQLCVNTVGKYRCEVKCGPGFRHRTAGTENRTRIEGCEDVDECVESSVSPCQHQCFNTLGSFRCGCLPGYQLVGHRCFDINECLRSVCPSHQQCKNTDGGYQCFDNCPSGMTQAESGVCVDVDECKDGSHMCRYSQICQNTLGGYLCVCPRGYRSQGVGKPCVDVDECAQSPSPCGYQCRNVPGSFRCLCPPGTVLLVDGRSCAGLERGNGFSNRTWVRVGLQPQLVSTRGQTLTLLQNTQPGAPWNNLHTCPPGYTSKASSCVDIDECALRKPCQHECQNSVGSFQCFCPSGYQLMPNGQTCRDIDECIEHSVQCGPNQMCFNMRGSYQCLDTPCPASYRRGGSPGVCYKPCSHGCAEGSSLLLQYKLLTLPLGIPAQHNVIRLSAFSESGVLQERTLFAILEQSGEITEQLFGIKDEAGRGIIFTTHYLNQSGLVKLKVQATTLNQHGQITYQSLFIIYISISAYPY